MSRDRTLKRWTRLVQPFRWRQAVLCAPALGVILTLGLLLNRLTPALIAAGGALAVGFGASRRLLGLRWGAMLAAALGMTAAAFIGSLAGQWPIPFLLLSATAAAACARLALVHEDQWWTALQAVIALFVAGYYAGPLPQAIGRAEAVLAGGALQIAVVATVSFLAPAVNRPAVVGPAKPRLGLPLEIGHAARAFVCVIGCDLLANGIGFGNRYWAPMTVMLVLKPGLHETQTRGLERLAGTVVGATVDSGVAIVVGAHAEWLVAAVTLSAGLAYALEKAAYPLLAAAITCSVVLLLTVLQHDPIGAAEHRLGATVLGGALALLVARVAPHPASRVAAAPDRVGD